MRKCIHSVLCKIVYYSYFMLIKMSSGKFKIIYSQEVQAHQLVQVDPVSVKYNINWDAYKQLNNIKGIIFSN